MKFKFPIELQQDINDCGPTALKMVAQYYGIQVSLRDLCKICRITDKGVSLKKLRYGAEHIGLHSLALQCTYENLIEFVPFPAIVLLNNCHFAVIFKANRHQVHIADPQMGFINLTVKNFCQDWLQQGKETGILLAIQPNHFFLESLK